MFFYNPPTFVHDVYVWLVFPTLYHLHPSSSHFSLSAIPLITFYYSVPTFHTLRRHSLKDEKEDREPSHSTFGLPSRFVETLNCTVQHDQTDNLHSIIRRRSCSYYLTSHLESLTLIYSEYKKGESQTNVEIMNEEDFNSLLRQEEEYIETICAHVRTYPPPSSHLIWFIWSYLFVWMFPISLNPDELFSSSSPLTPYPSHHNTSPTLPLSLLHLHHFYLLRLSLSSLILWSPRRVSQI